MATNNLTIAKADASQREACLKLAMDELVDEQQAQVVASLLPVAQTGIDPLASLYRLSKNGTTAAACWVQPQIGRIGSLWLGTSTDSLKDAEIGRLIAASVGAALEQGLSMVQVLVDPIDYRRGPWLSAGGLTELANLDYFEWQAEWNLPVADLPSLTITGHATAKPTELARVLQQSYDATRDCPQLGSVRDVHDTIAGYQSAEHYNPSLWYLAEHRGEAAGVLLLTPYFGHAQLELTYMGVLPTMRGQGIGRALVAHAQRITRLRKFDRLVLAADAGNSPAADIYRAQGFQIWAHRTAWFRASAKP